MRIAGCTTAVRQPRVPCRSATLPCRRLAYHHMKSPPNMSGMISSPARGGRARDGGKQYVMIFPATDISNDGGEDDGATDEDGSPTEDDDEVTWAFESYQDASRRRKQLGSNRSINKR
eukprot:1894962-Pyramimonas_sp.AAC.1